MIRINHKVFGHYTVYLTLRLTESRRKRKQHNINVMLPKTNEQTTLCH